MPKPTSSSTAVRPVESLREHVTALEAAITLCLGDPASHAVHKLRSESRRIEAHVDLLRRLKGLPPFRNKAAKALSQLDKLRRAAGRVRDLDVQQKLIDDHLPADTIQSRKDRDDLHHATAKQRKRATRKLLKLLQERQQKISRRLEALLHALEPAADLTLLPTDLLALADKDFLNSHAMLIRNPSDEHLHSIRKAAKLARYQLELAPASAQAKRAAKRYQSLQEAGGQWHDWLTLADVATHELGDDHPTAAHYTELRDQHLNGYRSQLDSFRDTAKAN
jgi:CHAD domain-containing protein